MFIYVYFSYKYIFLQNLQKRAALTLIRINKLHDETVYVDNHYL